MSNARPGFGNYCPLLKSLGMGGYLSSKSQPKHMSGKQQLFSSLFGLVNSKKVFMFVVIEYTLQSWTSFHR